MRRPRRLRPAAESEADVQQFYGEGGAPIDVEGDPTEPLAAWRQRGE